MNLTTNKTVLLTLTLFMFINSNMYGQDEKINLYVWDFTTIDGETNELTERLTGEFDEKIFSCKNYSLLNRMDFADIVNHINNEEAIMKIQDLSKSTKDSLKLRQAEAVAFGKVDDNIESGQITVRITIQSFNGQKLSVGSISFSRGEINSPGRTLQLMEQLVSRICEKEPLRKFTKWPSVLTGLSGIGLSTYGVVKLKNTENIWIKTENKLPVTYESLNKKYKNGQIIAYVGGAISAGAILWYLLKNKQSKKAIRNNISFKPIVPDFDTASHNPINSSLGFGISINF